MKEKLFDIGNKVSVDTERIICIMPIMSTSRKLMVQAEKEGKLIDATGKKKKSSVILTENGTVFISWVQPETLRKRYDGIVTR